MALGEFRRGAIVSIDGEEYELIQKLNCGPWQLRQCVNGIIVTHDESALRSFHEEGQLSFVIDSMFYSRAHGRCISLDLISKLVSDEAKMRYAIVKEVVRAELPYLTGKTLKPVIEEAYKKLGLNGKPPHWVTVYRWYRRYMNGGEDIRALVSQHMRKGNRSARYDGRTIEFVKKAIENLYLSPQRHTIKTVLKEAIKEIRHENKFLPPEMHIDEPTRSLVSRLIKEIPLIDVDTARFGRQYAVKKYRSVRGPEVAEYPLQYAQIDHTVLDLMVVDEVTALPLGRPTFTACIDVATRCVLGVHVSFEPPNFIAVAECLKHSILSKEYIKTRYPHIKHSWESYGVMQVLVVDNGLEFHGTNFENACYSLGISIEYKPRKTPWGKGIIERFIGSLNRAVAHKLPGTTFSSALELKDYDPVKMAIVTMAELMKYIHEWVCDEYHMAKHRTLKCAPIEMWRAGVANHPPRMPVSRDELDVQIGALHDRKLTHKGIELNGLVYNSSELALMRKRLGTTLDVTVRHNPADISTIYVMDPVSQDPVPAYVINGHWTKNMTEYQLTVCKRYAAINLGGTDMIKLAQAKDEVMEIVAEALGDKRLGTRKRVARFAHDASGKRYTSGPNQKQSKGADNPPELERKMPARRALPSATTDYTDLDIYVDELPAEVLPGSAAMDACDD